MKNYFIELAQFNIWANNKFISWINQLTEEQFNQEITSSFSSIQSTCLHIAAAEKIWLDRWQLVANPEFIATNFKGSKADLITIWQQASADILFFIESLNEKDFAKNFSFSRLNGDLFHMQYSKTFAHIFNHSTFHRGQLITMLRQAKFTSIDSTDILSYYREIEK
jgi:uncharacterized damage-inducible protein DinB